MSDHHGVRRSLPRRAVLTGATAVVLVLITSPALASPSSTADRTVGATGGTVYAVAQVGDRTVIGGDFTAVGGVPRQHVAAILADGTLDQTWNPGADGTVYALAASADGSRIFLGGTFTSAGGAARSRLAAVDATTGAAVPGWTADTNGDVRALAAFGDRLYVGGAFTTVQALAIRRLAAVSMSTGVVSTTFKPWPDWTVRGLAVSPDGTKVYPVGGFTTIAGVARKGAAEILAATGRATAFAPTDGGALLAVGITPDGSRIFFSNPANVLFAYDPAVSNGPVWTVKTGGDVQAVAASATEVYIGGHFSQISTFKVKRAQVASLLVTDGTPTAWAPALVGSYMGVWAITTSPDRVVIGGDFTKVGSRGQPGVARFGGGTV
jgi:uncharacterized membrane protein